MSLEVVIYGSAGCHWCKVAKDFFDIRNITYKYKDVTDPLNLKEMLEINGGQKAIPTIVIGDHFTICANGKKLEAMLKAAKGLGAAD